MTSGTGAAGKKRQYTSTTYFDNAVTALLIRLPMGPKKTMEDQIQPTVNNGLQCERKLQL